MRVSDHPTIPAPQVGVLLVNLGTPDDASPAAVKRYLREFLSDRRVVEIPALLWQPILRGIILNTRPKKSAANYAKVWDHDAGDSPLRVITRAQAAALQPIVPGALVDWAMRYGSPSIPARLAALKEAGCTRILIAPLYPQYSAATTATVMDKVFATLNGWRWQPALRTLPPYHDDAAYIDALAASVEAGLATLDFEPEVVLASFHGMPARTLKLGDPYHCHCQKTARLLREKLGWPEGKLRLTFQSRFGRAEWLKPYTDPTLRALPGEGIRRVAVVAPGFAADCLETLEEIAIQGRESFEHAGGERFAYLPCLNASTRGVAMLRTLVARELEGWIAPA
ncbi:ferrochelatase [Sphingoaurantiacus capsulatus]|uniref:Ferrochelatase n=1 Tax=Sphingoaurantiacus capsulatus TaxID=1771310 RepID=A0ABV7XAN9_9SPHN